MNIPALIVVSIMALFVYLCFVAEREKEKRIEEEEVELFI